MAEASSTPVKDPVSRRKSRRRQQITIMVACVVIATALWFLRAFENEYTTHVDHPVKYLNMPDKMITLNPLPQRISLQVKGLGFSVLKHNWNFSKAPLVIDFRTLKSLSYGKKKGFIEYLPMNQYFNEFSTQLKDLKVLAVKPDTLIFRFAYKKIRNVRVVPVFKFDSDKMAIPDSLIKVTPQMVELDGPDLLLDTLHAIYTLPVRVNRQGASFSRSIGLQSIDKLIRMKPEKVTVSIGKNP